MKGKGAKALKRLRDSDHIDVLDHLTFLSIDDDDFDRVHCALCGRSVEGKTDTIRDHVKGKKHRQLAGDAKLKEGHDTKNDS